MLRTFRQRPAVECFDCDGGGKKVFCGGMKSLEELTKEVVQLRDERDWKQFHNAKDLALSLSLEASEFLELFQWKNGAELEQYVKTHKDRMGEELSDILYHVLLIIHDFEIPIEEVFTKKLEEIRKKYPVEKSRGSNKKYSEL